MVDVAAGWFECRAVTYRSQRDIVAALQTMPASLPLPLLGIDSDNTVPSSTPTCSTIASWSTPPSPAPDPARRTTKPASSNRTVPSSAVWSAMTAMKAKQPPSPQRRLRSARLGINLCQPSMKLVEKH
jgi:hypothetical protein